MSDSRLLAKIPNCVDARSVYKLSSHSYDTFPVYACPNCGIIVSKAYGLGGEKYCHECGQAIEWGGVIISAKQTDNLLDQSEFVAETNSCNASAGGVK